ncbi:N-acetyltransferase [Plantibacter sp. PA-3-X8]|jgi:GNAT superfamily N-acetyltransferase|uniref:Ribosomal protein S18 acetylase RimI-like enzyme n=1 Tax=Plantibacter flavus TaxID=150123 RepID=A0A3N2C374_9MICO|nr:MULTISPECIES: GNAT family N-acetyltransferase [Plantibacter]AZH83958.1 N-acetyltransferase [Plantibacter sp. PA-3-X8]MBD8466176.1 GNAT family N-acetyltransferase [Plantibacter sp. CFBP 8798]MDD9153162.1 GNAT family N-acetyltransferase [Plantibacter flavus]ROR81967.1 ribosomal protein S18 acetylase RimI-like enzyme [Plantibacter flavus]SMG18886.1 Ribosomal protein S18 acetylase RimI [Plantibacter flavus]
MVASFSIRRGQSDDRSAVFALAGQLITGSIPPAADDFMAAYNNVMRPREDETNVLYVAVDESDRVVGYTLMTVSRLLHAAGLTAHLQELVVDETARGAGIGSALVEANEHYAVERGARQLTMSTSRAGDFYRRLGYNVTAEFYKKILPLG